MLASLRPGCISALARSAHGTTAATAPTVAATLATASSKREYHAIIMGPPGGGKGTISSWLVRDFHFRHLSSGDLLRKQIASKTPLGQEADSYIKQGLLVPDAMVLNIVLAELDALDPSEHWLLDGFPRTLQQAEELERKHRIDTVINLDIPHAEIVERIKHRWVHVPSGRVYHTIYNPPKVAGKDDATGEALIQREDDKQEAVQKRLQKYQEMTRPLLQHYERKRLLQNFEGTRSDVIYPSVEQYLRPWLKNSPLQKAALP